MAAIVEPWQRHKRRNPCLICGGGEDDTRRRGIRCAGYISKDEQYEYCEHPDYAGALELDCRTSPPTYKHKLHGACNCGLEHNALQARPMPTARKPEQTTAKAPTRAHKRVTPDRIHVYHNADGSERFRVLRVGDGSGKKFIQQRPDGAGDWLDGLEGMAPVLYHLPDLLAADPAQPVYIVEGEKCADRLAAAGLIATTNAGGALKWHNTPETREQLAGRHVFILPDNDPDKPDKPHESRKGQRHAAEVAADLYGAAASVRVLMLPGLPVKGDVYDWLEAGHTVDELQALAEVWPEWSPAQNSWRATQDASPVNEHGACPNCERLAEQLRREQEAHKITTTSLTNLRRERALEDKWMAVENGKLGAPEKLALLALRRELTDKPHERNEEGLARFYRASVAQRTGVKENAAGGKLLMLKKKRVILHDVKTSFDDSAMFVGPGELYDTPEALDTPERANTWGGYHKSKPRCPECKSDKLEAIEYACTDCGCVTTAQEAIAAAVEYDLEMAAKAAAEAQDNPPPQDSIRVMHLVSPGMNSEVVPPAEAPDDTEDDDNTLPPAAVVDVPTIRIISTTATPLCPDCNGPTHPSPVGLLCRSCVKVLPRAEAS